MAKQVTAHFLLRAPRYVDGTFEKIHAPIFISLASEDIEISNEFVMDKAGRARSVTFREYKSGHFGLYHDSLIRQVIGDQIDFLTDVFEGTRAKYSGRFVGASSDIVSSQ